VPSLSLVQQAAGMHADYQTLKAARKLGMHYTDRLLEQVALTGDLAKLKRVYRKTGQKLSSTITCYAAGSGSTAMVKWLGSQNVGREAVMAIRHGHLNMLKYLYKNFQTDWKYTNSCDDDDMKEEAVLGDHIQILNWLIEHGVTYDDEIALLAAQHNRDKVLEHVLDNPNTWDTAFIDGYKLKQLLHAAGAFGSLEACRWLRNNGASWPNVHALYWPPNHCPRDALCWSEDTVEWAKAEGCTSLLSDSDYDSEYDDDA
jgi:hypothetical protein